ncbi:MAG: DHA2 family efflux MFS transporter permease subunit [Gemmatimonadaceae bacterium]
MSATAIDSDIDNSGASEPLAPRTGGGVKQRHAPADDPYKYKWLIAAGVVLASVMELIDTSIVNVALTQMSANLGTTLDEITWVTVGYILASVIVLPMTGWFSSFFGRKRYFTASIAIFTVASFFCGFASTLGQLVFWRIVQGIGGGALISTSQAILFESFPPNQKTVAAAVFGIGMMVGPALGPTLGGVIVDQYTWPWIFYVNIPFGILAMFMVATYVHDAPQQQRATRIDIPGFALLAVGIGSLQFVLERGEHYEWFDSPLIVLMTAVSAIALVTMVWWELHTDTPVLDLRVLKNRSLASGATFAVALGMGLYGSVFALPIMMQQLLQYDAALTGWLLLPGAIASATAMFGIVRFGTKVDLRALIITGAVILAFSMVLHARIDTESGPDAFFWPVALRGFGTGLMFVPLATSALAGLKGRDLAQGTAIFNLTRQLGGSAGIAILATLLTRQGAVHRATLVAGFGAYDPVTTQRLAAMTRAFIAKGFDPLTAQRKGYAVLDRLVQGQSLALAFADVFRSVAVIMLLSIPLVFLLKRPSGQGPAADIH